MVIVVYSLWLTRCESRQKQVRLWLALQVGFLHFTRRNPSTRGWARRDTLYCSGNGTASCYSLRFSTGTLRRRPGRSQPRRLGSMLTRPAHLLHPLMRSSEHS